jgi:ATP-dependent helicase STH1/SNF2
MQQLKAAGETEQSSQELANLVNILRYFQQVQLMKQQQQQQQQLQQQAQQSASQANAQQAASSSSSQRESLVKEHLRRPMLMRSPAAASTSQAATPAAAAASTPAAPAPEAASTPAAAANGDHSSANGANGVVASASGPASQAASAAAPSPAANGTPTTNAPSAFTPEQLAALKTQIIAFKLISRNMPLPPHLQAALLNPDAAIDEIRGGLPDLQSLGEAGAVAEAGVAAHQAAELVSTAKEEAAKAAMVKRPATPKDDTSSAVYPYNALRQPFTYLSKPATGPEDSAATKQQRLLVPSLLPAGLDPQLLIAERDRLIAARVQQRIRELESLPSTISQWPTLRGADAAEMKREQDGRNEGEDLWESSTFEADNAKIKALIELKSLKLLEKQKALRHSLVRGFSAASTLALDRTAFRKFKKQTLRDARLTETLERKQRADRERRTRQKHTDYLNTIVAHGRELQAAHRNAQSNAQRIGKSVLRLHAETEKEEAKRLERIAKERLNALRADDEEAYLKLVDTAKDTRITHLIRQTDAYLGSLADAVQAQQNDDVHADAIAAERAGIAPPTAEELAAQTANQQVGVAVDETMFGARREDDPVEKGKVDYYSVAHRITEHITEQPTILVGGKLKHYQIKGLQWMVSLYNNRLNGILADEMGLGKTIQTISLITFLIEHKRQPGPYLVIVPLSTLTNWINEFEKWAPSVNTLVFKGPPLARKHLSNRIRAGNFQVLLTTYEYIIKEKGLLGKIRWTHMIIDEGHRMKNTQSKLTITLMQSYVSRYRLLLTGTPLQNNLPELWALLNFVLPKIFNSVKSFDEWFNTPFANTGTSGDGAMQLNEEEALLIIKRLHKVLRPFLLRRLKKDVESELPDKVEKVIKCKMSSLQRKLYQQMKNHKMLLAGDEAGPGQKQKQQGIKGLQNAIMQLRKICNHPYVFEQVEVAINPMKQNGPDLYRVCGKFELLDRLLPKLKATGHRVLIFFQMTAIMDIMEDFLRYRNHKYLRLDGSTKPDDRSLQLKEFNAPNSDIFCFILSTRAGGLGLNLQTADTVIIYDSDWNRECRVSARVCRC